MKIDKRKLLRVDHTGKGFGFLTVIARGARKSHWLCACACGNEKEIYISNLCRGDIKSCGCKTNLLLNNTKISTATLVRRFEKFYIPEPNSGCWIWTGTLHDNDDGYGRFKSGKKLGLAHRASFRLFKGEIPVGMMVLHSCDLRCCVNPDHLSIGDGPRNMQDMVDRGRSMHGERNHHAKLTSTQVADIRATYTKRRGNLIALAEKYGVGRFTIHNVLKRITWTRQP